MFFSGRYSIIILKNRKKLFIFVTTVAICFRRCAVGAQALFRGRFTMKKLFDRRIWLWAAALVLLLSSFAHATGLTEHVHQWEYSRDGEGALKATCTGEGLCPSGGPGGAVSLAVPQDPVYDGSAKEALVTNTLVTDAAVEVVYSGNTTEGKPVNVGTYTATITLGGVSASVEFTIQPRPLTADMVQLSEASAGYTGFDLTPGVVVSYKDMDLDQSDCDLAWSAAPIKELGTYTLTVTGQGNYSGTVQKTFTVEANLVVDVQWPTLAPIDYGQTLAQIILPQGFAWEDPTQVPGVNNSGYPLVFTPGDTVHFDYSAVPGWDAASGTVRRTTVVTVTPAAGVGQVTIDGWIYGETPKTPVITSETHDILNAVCLYEGNGYSGSVAPARAGTYTLTVSIPAQGNYGALTVSTEFAVQKKTVTAHLQGEASKTYDGTVTIPENHTLLVVVQGVVGADEIGCRASFAYAKADAGTTQVLAALTLEGGDADNYILEAAAISGSVGTIRRKSIEDVALTVTKVPEFRGEKKKITFTVGKVDGLTITYTASGDSVTRLGTNTLTITGTGNFTGKASVKYAAYPDADFLQKLTVDTVTSESRDELETLLNLLENANTSGIDGDVKKQWQQWEEDCRSLMDAIEEAANAAYGDDIAQVEDIYAENVALSDKLALEKAEYAMQQALREYGSNYTEDEKEAMEEELGRIQEALEVITQTQQVESMLSQLPVQVQPGDQNAAQALANAKAAFEALTEYQQAMLPQARAQLDQLAQALVDYKILQGGGSTWDPGSDRGLVFALNGHADGLEKILVGTAQLSQDDYHLTADGSTVTLQSAYLQTLQVGQHTITVVYRDGKAESSFTVQPAATEPSTSPTTPTQPQGQQQGAGLDWYWWLLPVAAAMGGAAVLLSRKKRSGPKE